MDLIDELKAKGFSVSEHNVGEGGSAFVKKIRTPISESSELQSDTDFALKIYKPHIMSNPEQKRRIKQEWEIGTKLSHPNIVKAYSYLEDEDRSAVLMEWISGDILSEWIAKNIGSYSWDDVKSLSLKIIEAIDEIHKIGAFHRDIKSENIMICTDGTPKLMDLGIVEVVNDDNATMHTNMKDFIGTIRSASPNFLNGDKYDAKDDIYSFGTVLYELCTGVKIYDKIHRKVTLTAAILRNEKPEITILEELPKELRYLINGVLNSSRDRRPTIEQLKEAINDLAGSDYLKKEKNLQTRKIEGMAVLSMQESSQCIARLDRRYELNTLFRVVRFGDAFFDSVRNENTHAEIYVADVILKHEYNNYGVFIPVRIRKARSPQPTPLYYPSSKGEFEHTEINELKVRKGDIILPTQNNGF